MDDTPEDGGTVAVDPNKPLTSREAYAQTHISPSTVARWRRDGHLPKDAPLTIANLIAAQERARAAHPQVTVQNVPPIREAARLLGVSRTRILQWQRNGMLPKPLTPEAVASFRARVNAQAAQQEGEHDTASN